MREQNGASLSSLEADIQSTLAAIVEIDCWYGIEHENLDFYPEAIRNGVSAEIERRHRLNRQPYILHLAYLHQMIVSARIFGDPVEPARTRRNGYDLFPTALRSKPQHLYAPHGRAQLNYEPPGSAAVTNLGASLAPEALSRGGADQP